MIMKTKYCIFKLITYCLHVALMCLHCHGLNGRLIPQKYIASLDATCNIVHILLALHADNNLLYKRITFLSNIV